MTTNYVYNIEQVYKKINNMSTKADPEVLTLQTRKLEVIVKNFSTRKVNSSAIF